MAPDDSLCRSCERRPRWLDPRRSGGWQVCTTCLRWNRDCLRRRHDAALRLPPLASGHRDPWLAA